MADAAAVPESAQLKEHLLDYAKRNLSIQEQLEDLQRDLGYRIKYV